MLTPASSARAQSSEGIRLFEQYCVGCHGGPTADNRAPDRESLKQRTPEAILNALTTGSMAINAKELTAQQKRVLAEQFTGHPLGAVQAGPASAMKNHCESKPLGDPRKMPMWNGWGADLGNSRFQPASSAGITADQVPKLKLRWAFGFPNGRSGYGQPTIVGGRVFVGSDIGFVYSLDATSGCVYWSYQTKAGVRTAISVGPLEDSRRARYAVYFGDVRANVYAIDAETGALLWTKRADSHLLAGITGAPTLEGGRLYVPVSSLEEDTGHKYECCTFRGSVVAYDAITGRQLWKRYTISAEAKRTGKNSVGKQLWGPAGVGVWCSPTIDVKRHVLYIGTGNAYTQPAGENSDAVLALDLKTGRPTWVRQITPNDAWILGCGPKDPDHDNCPDPLGPDFDFSNSPILRELPDGRAVLSIGQKSGVAYGLDPDHQGAVLWQHRVGKGTPVGGVEWGGAADNEVAYFPNSDISLGPAEAGGLFALKLTNGEEVWHTRPPVSPDCKFGDWTCVAAQSAAVTVIPGVVFSGTTDGIMRAYATTDGRVLWEYNTVREYTTVNGVPAKGGAINGPGPTVAGGMLFMNSGYGYIGNGLPGNVLLAFGIN